MGRYIGVPESLITEIENIVPVARRFNNRCLYTTPGTYTFTVPVGVTCINAVAVGPGGTQCSILECMITCGTIACLSTSMCVIKKFHDDAGSTCMLSSVARDPVENICTCAFEVCRYLCSTTLKDRWSIYIDQGTSGCYMCAGGKTDFTNQTMKFSYFPSGPGGGYTEKAANTVAGCTYTVIVGQNCSVGGFSCVSGQNVSICATGPIMVSCAGLVDANNSTFYNISGTWRTPDAWNYMDTCSISTSCSGTTPWCCFACFSKCGSRGELAYCIESRWCACVAQGQGFGGDINRTGGFCCLSYTTQLLTSNPCYPCGVLTGCCSSVLGTGSIFACGAAACTTTGGYTTNNCCGASVFCCILCTPFVSSCGTGSIGTFILSMCMYKRITQYCTPLDVISGACTACIFQNNCAYFTFSQSSRETGNTISCITNFNFNSPGNFNPYCSIKAGCTGCISTTLCHCTCMLVCDITCPGSVSGGSASRQTICGGWHTFIYDWKGITPETSGGWCGNPYYCMNCVLVGNTCNRFKFGGSSAGNFYGNGVSALNDSNVYTLCCNRNFGHCDTTPATVATVCNMNGLANITCMAAQVTTPEATTMCLGPCAFMPFLYNISTWWRHDTGNCCTYSLGTPSLSCQCKTPILYGIPVYECSTSCNCDMYSFPTTGTCTVLDMFRVHPLPGISRHSSISNHKSNAYHDMFINWAGNVMFNNLQAGAGCTCFATACTCCNRFSPYYLNAGFNGLCFAPCGEFRIVPAKTCMKYYSTVACVPLDCCGSCGPNPLVTVVPLTSGTRDFVSYNFFCNLCTTVMVQTAGYNCRYYGLNCYWPCALCYDFCNTTCRVNNLNPLLNLYDYICSNPEDRSTGSTPTCVGINTPFCHLLTFGSMIPLNTNSILTNFYFPQATTVCCVYKSSDKITVNDALYNAQYVHNFGYCLINTRVNPAVWQGGGCGVACHTWNRIVALSQICFDQCKVSGICNCSLAACCYYAQGGAGIGTAGIWGEGTVSCNLTSSGGGNIKCLSHCLNLQATYCNCSMGCCWLQNLPCAAGWGMNSTLAQITICDTLNCGSGAIISPNWTAYQCCAGVLCVPAPCGNATIPNQAGVPGTGHLASITVLCGGINYSTSTNTCAQLTPCMCVASTYSSTPWRSEIDRLLTTLPCCNAPVWCNNGCPFTFTAAGPLCGLPVITPAMCVCVVTPFSNYSNVVATYAEGSGGGSKTGIPSCAKYSSITESSSIVSVSPARGGRGNEAPYDPYYFSYPGISARINTPKSPATYVGDNVSGCSWFDTNQILGSGGNGTFCSEKYACIFVQGPGPGGGGANGITATGTTFATGGVLGGGAGCCGAGGAGGGAGWNGTPGNGMVVIYW
jgi:hypothetical protein